MQLSPFSFSPAAKLLASSAAVLLCNGLAVAQHPADEPCGAITVVDGINGPFDTTGATGSGLPTLGCSSVGNDIWLQYTAAASGALTVETCGAATDYDTKLAIYDGTPGCASLGMGLACNDDACPGFKSALTVAATSGTTYYIALGGFGSGTGNAEVEITLAAPPPNDECLGALAVTNGFSGPFTNSAASASPEPWSCGFNPDEDVWFKYCTEAGGTLDVDTCTGGTNDDTILEVYSGTCGNLTSIACNDDAGCGNSGFASSVSASVGPGTYWIRVSGWNGGIVDFGLSISGPAGSGGAGTIGLSSTSCNTGFPALSLTGDPELGGTLTAVMSGYTGIPFVTYGLPPSTVPLSGCSGCVVLTNLTNWILGDTIGVTIPCLPGFIGLPLSAQGVDLFGSSATCFTLAPSSFTHIWVATIG